MAVTITLNDEQTTWLERHLEFVRKQPYLGAAVMATLILKAIIDAREGA